MRIKTNVIRINIFQIETKHTHTQIKQEKYEKQKKKLMEKEEDGKYVYLTRLVRECSSISVI